MGLIDKMNELKSANAISMHVPGHKNKTIGNLNEIEISFDQTEISILDNLHEPTGVLKELNDFLSKKYEGYIAQAMTNGSTTGILSGLFALMAPKSTLYILGDAHKSVHHAAELLKVFPKTFQTFDELQKDDVVVVTSPTYTGDTKDIETIIPQIHERGARVFIDEAHGAHFDITDNFPKSAMNFGADIVVQSYHKGLPSLTGASVLFVKDKDTHRRAMKYIDMFETSSPSYLSMLSIESGHEFYLEYDDQVFFLMRKSLIDALKENDIEVKETKDPAKLILNKTGISPFDLEKSFERLSIYSEMTTKDGVLWCLPLWHDGDTFPFDLLLERISMVEFLKSEKVSEIHNLSVLQNKKAIRRVVPYPPGIPFMNEGDVFTTLCLEELMQQIKNNVKIEGLEDNLDYYTER